MNLICIDPGHPSFNGDRLRAPAGALINEPTATMCIALCCAAHLYRHGVLSILTRLPDLNPAYPVSLRKRIADANSQPIADALISIHTNASTNTAASGFEVFHHPGSVEGKRLAAAIASTFQLSSVVQMPSRGVHEGRFYVLKHSSMPAVLVECGFLTNAHDQEIIAGQYNDCGVLIAQGCLVWLSK